MDIIKMLIALLYHYYLNWWLFKSSQDEKTIKIAWIALKSMKNHLCTWKNPDDFYK